MHKLHASKDDLEVVSLVIRDVKESVTCDIGVGGSIAQRAIAVDLEEIASRELKDSDIDLILLTNSYDSCPVLSSINKKFEVIEKNVSEDSCYFGLVHKQTGKWVDLFPLLKDHKLKEIIVGSNVFLATSIESQIKYLANDLLTRARTGLPVRKKWIDKLRLLYEWQGLEKTDIRDDESQIEKALSLKPSSKLGDVLRTTRQLLRSRWNNYFHGN
jgi:hypothetical protein